MQIKLSLTQADREKRISNILSACLAKRTSTEPGFTTRPPIRKLHNLSSPSFFPLFRAPLTAKHFCEALPENFSNCDFSSALLSLFPNMFLCEIFFRFDITTQAKLLFRHSEKPIFSEKSGLLEKQAFPGRIYADLLR
ncbi:MAG: hypothetical protein R2941_20370 [Desulfobacterales bacterium]